MVLTPKRQIALVRFLGALTVGGAVILAFGLSKEYDLYNFVITLGCFLLAVVTYLQGHRSWAFGFLAAAVVFNPFFRIAFFERNLWTILDIALTLYTGLFILYSTDPFQKGTVFEQFVSTLFPEPRFTMVDRTRDISKFANRLVESDSNPDFIFRDKKTNTTFAVECKYASRWWNRMGQLGFTMRNYQLENYRKFSVERNIPVYIAFGIGGIPKKPKEVYFVPLEKIKYDFVWQSVVRGGKRAGEF